MIRSRLRITLSMVLAVVIGLGLGAVILVHSHTKRFSTLLSEEFSAIDSTKVVLFHTNIIQGHALQRITSPSLNREPLAAHPIIRQSLQVIDRAQSNLITHSRTKSEIRANAELAALVKNLVSILASDTSSLTPQNEGGQGLAGRLSDTSIGISRLCQRISALHGAGIEQGQRRVDKQNQETTVYVVILTLVALFILFVIYRQFDYLALRPLAKLTESVKEVENRNFELSLPEERNDEIGKLSRAYNNMAAELRRLYRETDKRIVDLNQRNRALLTAMPNAVIVLDDDGNLIQVNPEAETILDSSGTTNRLPAKLEHLFQESQRSGKNFLPEDLDEALLFRIDETEHYFLPRVFRLPRNDEMDAAWGIILSDVSRFRWLDDMKMNVLATVSHEIKTPLTSIRMVLHLLLEKKIGDLSDMQEEMVGSAAADCERLLTTLANLLHLGRLNSGTKHLELEARPARTVFDSIPLSLQQLAAEKHVRLVVNENEESLAVMIDHPRIVQVVTNLISNAIKFSPAESPVTLSFGKLGANYVRFKVQDHGPGVSPESQDKLFERFYRDPGQSNEGTGLGLSIAREIINAHEGRIGYLNDPRSPTTFYFDLSLA